jgi:hypothetical protein
MVQGLTKARLPSKFSTSKLASRRYQDPPVGYRPVRVDWKDLDKCSVCHMDEVKASFYCMIFHWHSCITFLLTLFAVLALFLFSLIEDWKWVPIFGSMFLSGSIVFTFLFWVGVIHLFIPPSFFSFLVDLYMISMLYVVWFGWLSLFCL